MRLLADVRMSVLALGMSLLPAAALIGLVSVAVSDAVAQSSGDGFGKLDPTPAGERYA